MDNTLSFNLENRPEISNRKIRQEVRKEKINNLKDNLKSKGQKTVNFVKAVFKGFIALVIAFAVGALALLALKGNILPSGIITNQTEVTDVIVSEKLSNIGELMTQEDRLSDMETIKDYRKFFDNEKAKIPGTTKELVYSYDVVVKAGYNFEDIKFSIDDNVINVKLPKAEIFDCYIENEKLIDEKNNIFNPIKGDEFESRKEELKEKNKAKAIESGLLDKAEEHAKDLICEVLQFDGYVVSFR